jgi:hypothetical protein
VTARRVQRERARFDDDTSLAGWQREGLDVRRTAAGARDGREQEDPALRNDDWAVGKTSASFGAAMVAFARPKSSTFTVASGFTLMF